ncbi:MAG: polymer-forming cytoskeletal protein [Parvibaculum sp.]|uniref:bactofilin family protein n=1 Tax=Parvibaculum sp. TaxID=2024848 RepID=UPI0025DF283D|nr:polymer-forming cytoskeletal protein [Parvibaculum sp.]MCE9649930.1 polymer-forming cytoskeletal protein [Parvibaculum sp.]
MFKRPKDTDSGSSENETLPLSTGSRIIEKTASSTMQNESESSTNRVVTPSYEVRKPAVRTLQTHSSSNTGATTANLHVGRGLKLEGKIQSCDSLVIEGDVQATIESGTLTITETGEVRGEATVDQAEINGKFDGTLIVKKCLTINATGKITGTIRYGELKVEQGGKISGEVEATEGAANATRKTDTAASA